MTTTSWTQADITKLERAIATGTRKVVYETMGSVEYHSMDEMLKALDVIRRAVAAAALGGSIVSRPVRKFATFVRG